MMNENDFLESGNKFTKHNSSGSRSIGMRRFRGLFGCTPAICAWIWNYFQLKHVLPLEANPNHLLCALLFLKVYGTESTNKSITNYDEKTFRKWTWIFVELLAYQLDVVR